MRKFFVLFKKEVRELLTPAMILPLILMPVLFNVVGRIALSEKGKSEAERPGIILLDLDESKMSKELPRALEREFEPVYLTGLTDEEALETARREEAPVLLVIPSGFEKKIKGLNQEAARVYSVINNVSVKSATKSSSAARALNLVNNYLKENLVSVKFPGLNADFLKNPVTRDDYTSMGGKTAHIGMAQVIGFITSQTIFIPIVLFMVIIFASQTIVSSVVSEKENKTFETLLSLPINRNSIVFAKLLSAALFSLLSTWVYMIGFKSFMAGAAGAAVSSSSGGMIAGELAALGATISPYGYSLLGLSLFLSIICALLIVLVLGLLVDNTKSVQAVITPFMMVVILPYLLVTISDINSLGPVFRYGLYAIPFTHSFTVSQNLLSGKYELIYFGLLYQAVIALLCTAAATKIFSSDAILTLKFNFGKKL